MAMNQCDGCRRGLPLDENGTHSNPDGSYDHIGCTAHLYNDRRPFPVTDDLEDAPDGAVIQREDGWWARSGMMWYPVPAKDAPAELAGALKVYESDHGCALIGCKTGELCGMGVKGDPANAELQHASLRRDRLYFDANGLPASAHDEPEPGRIEDVWGEPVEGGRWFRHGPECRTNCDYDCGGSWVTEPSRSNPESSTCSCDQRGRNVSCLRCRP